MLKREISFKDLEMSSQLIRDLIEGKESATQFVDLPFKLESIPDQIRKKDFSDEKRQTLVDVLREQYDGSFHSAVKGNLDRLLSPNTYTITTGHQLNLLSGPLYSIYKVAQVISMSRELNDRYPDQHFVPVFWMASEDHDYEEIDHIHLFGKSIRWERETASKAVGRLDLSGVETFLSQVEDLYQDPEMKAKVTKLIEPYRSKSNLTEATRDFMRNLFDEYGLLILDGDQKELKEQMVSSFQHEVQEASTYNAVSEANEQLEKQGYHQQVYVRPCNLFHLSASGERTRIEKDGDQFHFAGKNYSSEELSAMIADKPQEFSPNALLRPLFQETILPNLVYTGGGGEIAYWLQLKGVFAAFNVPFPMVRVRDSYILLHERDLELMEEKSLSFKDLKEDLGVIGKELVLEEVGSDLDLSKEKALFSELQESLKERAANIHSGLVNSVEAELTKMEKFLSNIEGKMIRAEKKKHEVSLKKIEKLRDKIYPNRGFQERFENVLPYVLKDDNFVKEIVSLDLSNDPLIKIVNA